MIVSIELSISKTVKISESAKIGLSYGMILINNALRSETHLRFLNIFETNILLKNCDSVFMHSSL